MKDTTINKKQGSKQKNCTHEGCSNYGRYCRFHSMETFTPLPKQNKESDSLKEQLKIYRKEARKFISLHVKCQVKDCNKISECVHHKAGRIGTALLDKSKWLAVCLEHHRQIEENPDWAKENGYSESRLKEKA